MTYILATQKDAASNLGRFTDGNLTAEYPAVSSPLVRGELDCSKRWRLFMKSRKIVVTAALALALSIAGVGAPATAGPQPPSAQEGTKTTSFASESCKSQVLAIDMEADTSVCNVKVIETVGPVQVTTSKAEILKAVEGQSATVQAQALAAGAITYQNWSQTYYSGLTWEIMNGRVYWDGTYAWAASYRGYAGWHNCHAAGSISAGLVVSNIRNCNKPTAAASIVFRETFDWSFVVQGSPISGVCEMRTTYNRVGGHSAALSGIC
jgi:hypothetical protein